MFPRMIGFLVNIVAILIGLVALPIAFIGLVIGIANYVAIPIALFGALLGLLSGHKTGRNFNILVLIVAVIRLILGHGIF